MLGKSYRASFWKKTRIYMTRKRWSLNQINLIWSINQPRYIISYKVTHVACSISNIWWRWIFDKEEKEEEEKKTRKRSFLLQRSCCEFEIDPSGKQRKRHRNFLVPRKNFWTNIRLTRPKYLGNYSHRESLVRAYKRNPISKHFRRKYYGNEEKKKKITIETSEHSWFWKHLTISTSKNRFN